MTSDPVSCLCQTSTVTPSPPRHGAYRTVCPRGQVNRLEWRVSVGTCKLSFLVRPQWCPLHHHPLRVIIELRVLGPVQQVRTVHWSIVIIFINQSPCLSCSVSQFGPAAKAFGWYANDIGSIPGFGSFVSKINKYIRMCFLTSPRNE